MQVTFPRAVCVCVFFASKSPQLKSQNSLFENQSTKTTHKKTTQTLVAEPIKQNVRTKRRVLFKNEDKLPYYMLGCYVYDLLNNNHIQSHLG